MSTHALSETARSREAGVPQPTIHRMLNALDHEPRDSTLLPIAQFFGVTVEQLRRGLPNVRLHPAASNTRGPKATAKSKHTASAPMRKDATTVIQSEDTADDDPLIPIAEVDIILSTGRRKQPELIESNHTMSYPLSWFQQVGAKPSDVRVMKVLGDSMERTLFHGDRIAVNLADQRVVNNAVYVFMTGGADPDVRVKRFFRNVDGRLRIVSDHLDKTLYPDEILTAEDIACVTIVGRVIDRSGRGGL
jgi:phage repressor protein C with HTH and peptisase S24 domain